MHLHSFEPRNGWVSVYTVLSGSLLVCLMIAALNARAEVSTYQVDDFQRIYFTGAGTLKLIQGETVSASAKADAQILAGLTVDVSDGVLYVDAEPTGHRADDLVISLTVTDLRELVSDGDGIIQAESLILENLTLEGKGAGRFSFNNLHANELLITGRGSNAFDLNGEVFRQVVEIHGVGQYHAEDLASVEGEVSVMGSGDVLVWVQNLLDVYIGGAGRVLYSGTPLLTKRIFGFGTIRQVPIAR
jgi:hypothetical protein